VIDEQEFERFYRETLPKLEKFVARMASSRSVAEEVVQESYYRLLRTARAPAAGEERVRYLYRIAVNLMKNHWARAREHVELAPESLYSEPAPREDIAQAMARLAPRDRALLWLAYVEGYSHREMAEVMSVGAMSVRVLLSRARKRFMELMT
jgi:RNA polymerase sigma-70 factor, ECF subfamily